MYVMWVGLGMFVIVILVVVVYCEWFSFLCLSGLIVIVVGVILLNI